MGWRDRLVYDGADYTNFWTIHYPDSSIYDGSTTYHTFSIWDHTTDYIRDEYLSGPHLPMSHDRYQIDIFNRGPTEFDQNPHDGTWDHVIYHNVFPNISPPDLEASISFDDKVRAVRLPFEIKSWIKSFTAVQTSVSVPNFIYELKDFTEIEKIFDGYKRRKLLKATNDTFLNYNFNLSPFIGDLSKIVGLYDKVISRLEFLRKTWGKPVTFRNRLMGAYEPDYSSHSYLTPDGGCQYRLQLSKYSLDLFYSCQLTQFLEGLDDGLAVLRGMLAAGGFNNPAKIVWNAIPFSFIADMFIPFGDMLNAFAIQPFRGVILTKDIQSTVRTRALVDIYQHMHPEYGSQNSEIHVASAHLLRYARSLGFTFKLTDFQLADLTVQEKTILASLFGSLTHH